MLVTIARSTFRASSIVEIEADVRNCVSSSGYSLLAGLAGPDTDRVALHRLLSAECAHIFGMLCDFHLLYLLSERGAISVLRKRSVTTSLPISKALPEHLLVWKDSQCRPKDTHLIQSGDYSRRNAILKP
jgi:hypothetical protein